MGTEGRRITSLSSPGVGFRFHQRAEDGLLGFNSSSSVHRHLWKVLPKGKTLLRRHGTHRVDLCHSLAVRQTSLRAVLYCTSGRVRFSLLLPGTAHALGSAHLTLAGGILILENQRCGEVGL